MKIKNKHVKFLVHRCEPRCCLPGYLYPGTIFSGYQFAQVPVYPGTSLPGYRYPGDICPGMDADVQVVFFQVAIYVRVTFVREKN